MKTGLFGGSFNPVHIGHLRMAQDVLEQLELDRILFIPCNLPPHKEISGVAGPQHRVSMLELAIEGEPDLSVSQVEILRGGVSYTIDTVRELKELWPEDRFYFIIGSDSLLDLHTWREITTLLELVEFATVIRPGFDPGMLGERRLPAPWPERLARNLVQGHQMEISSSDIRMRVAEGMSIRWLVPRMVEMYIREHGLYLS